MPRLVTCHLCHTLTRIPDVPKGTPLVPAILEYTTGERIVFPDADGHPKMVPAFDPILEDFVTKHEHDLPERAVTHGQQIEVYAVDQRTWDAMDVVTKIKTELQRQTGEFYAERDEYREAALKCYNAHGNPDISTGCPDFLDDSKRIGPGSYDDGDGHTITVPPRFRHYLCHVCPFQQAVITVELRRRRGMYSDEGAINARNPKRHRRHR